MHLIQRLCFAFCAYAARELTALPGGCLLQGSQSPLEYCQAHAPSLGAYNGFNLVVADLRIGEMAYCTNRPHGQPVRIQGVPPGMYGLSNATLDTPWPKVSSTQPASFGHERKR